MGDPAEVAQKNDPHLRDLAVVDTVFPTAPRSEVDREIFPGQFLSLFQCESESDILKFKINRDLMQRLSQRVSAHKAVGHVWVCQIRAGQKPKQQPATKGNNHSTKPIITRPTITENAIVFGSIPIENTGSHWPSESIWKIHSAPSASAN